MSQKVIRVAPKRRVERVQANIYHAIGTTQNDLDLHAAEDAKTLVRMKGRISVVQIANFAAQVAQLHGIAINVNPAGTVVESVTVAAQSLDRDPPMTTLMQFHGAIIGRSATDPGTGEQIAVYEFDTKVMRKLKPGDTIGLRDIVSTEDGDSYLVGDIWMWFKE